MTIIPASRLTDHDLRLLGNNLPGALDDHEPDDELDAAERSLACLGEQVDWLDPRRPDEADYPDPTLRRLTAA